MPSTQNTPVSLEARWQLLVDQKNKYADSGFLLFCVPVIPDSGSLHLRRGDKTSVSINRRVSIRVVHLILELALGRERAMERP